MSANIDKNYIVNEEIMPSFKFIPPHKQRYSEKKEIRVRTLSLVLTHDCNLRCKYCYELHKENSGRTMPLSVAIEAITYCLHRDDEF